MITINGEAGDEKYSNFIFRYNTNGIASMYGSLWSKSIFKEFQDPIKAYTVVPFWSWNGTLNPNEEKLESYWSSHANFNEIF
jgi:hypothetical protein